MGETTTIVTSIVGSAGAIVTILGVMIRGINRQLEQTNRRIDDVRTDLKERLDDTNRRIDETRTGLNTRIDQTRTELSTRMDETNRRLERVETRLDQVGQDIGELRDRTGKLEGTVSTFIQSQGKVEAA